MRSQTPSSLKSKPMHFFLSTHHSCTLNVSPPCTPAPEPVDCSIFTAVPVLRASQGAPMSRHHFCPSSTAAEPCPLVAGASLASPGMLKHSVSGVLCNPCSTSPSCITAWEGWMRGKGGRGCHARGVLRPEPQPLGHACLISVLAQSTRT